MKHCLLLLILLLAFQSGTFSQNRQVLLSQGWQFRQAGTKTWHDASVPGTVHTDLLKCGFINDPFYRLNENDIQWIDKVNWEYRTHFSTDMDMKPSEEAFLVLDGLDTYADVFLNDSLILVADNMFVRWEVPVSRNLLRAENELRIYFHSPVFIGLQKLEAFGMPLPADNDQSEKGGLGPDKVSIFTRKAPYHYGWDWGPRLVTSGIWRNVSLKIVDKVSIDDLYVKQQKITSKKAELTAMLELLNYTSGNYELNIKVNGLLASSLKLSLPGSGSSIEVPISIPNPALWWPNGHGEQSLYHITAEITAGGNLIDSKSVTIGLRNIKLIRKADNEGESFYFEVNGKPVFAKGANYIPNDVFLPRVTPDKYEHIVSSAAKANMNMLRVWGGGIYENDLFYDLCDKYGIMVWQDFMFACAMYPADMDYYQSVTKEAGQNIKRLRSHACMALWCGNNEIEQAWAQSDEKKGWGWKQRYSLSERAIIWKAYDTIFHHILPDQVMTYNPEIPYWPSSPSAGMGKLASHTNTSGDMHYWGVWHGGEPIESFAKYKARFMSEYGFQSFPEFESVKQYTASDDWDIASQVMSAHQRSGIGNQRIKDYMLQWYNQPVDFEDQLYVGQLLQAEAIKKAIETHRSQMPYCMGSLYWQLNDCWPVASWSGIDYYGRWKALHYFAREAFKNQIVSVTIEGNNLVIRGISDVESTTGSLRINLMDFHGISLWNRSVSVSMPSNGSKVMATIGLDKLPAMQHKTDALLYVTFIKNERMIDSDIFYLEKPKNLQLPFPDISTHIRQRNDKYEIEITAKSLCKNLMLISEGNAYSFSDNYFDLLPGETKVITVESSLNYDEFEKKLSYTHLQQLSY